MRSATRDGVARRRARRRAGWRTRRRRARATVSAGRSAAASEPAICDQQLVADQVAEAVVDDLEAVEVEEEDGGQRARGSRRERSIDLPQAVHEQRAVGQAGQRVVQGVVEQLLLGLLAVGDVVGVEHDAGDRGLGEEVRGGRLEHPPGAVAVAHPVLEVTISPGWSMSGAGRRRRPPVLGMDEVEQALPSSASGSRPSTPLVGGALVAHRAVRLEDARSGPRRSGPASGSAPRWPAAPPRRAGGR